MLQSIHKHTYPSITIVDSLRFILEVQVASPSPSSPSPSTPTRVVLNVVFVVLNRARHDRDRRYGHVSTIIFYEICFGLNNIRYEEMRVGVPAFAHVSVRPKTVFFYNNIRCLGHTNKISTYVRGRHFSVL